MNSVPERPAGTSQTGKITPAAATYTSEIITRLLSVLLLRRDPLSLDALHTIAGAVGCHPSDLLPPHLSELHDAVSVRCQPWCQYQNDHRDERYREDQWCGSEELRIELNLEPASARSPRPDFVSVYATQNVGEPVRLNVSHADAPEVRFTPDEAQQLVEALQLVLGQVA